MTPTIRRTFRTAGFGAGVSARSLGKPAAAFPGRVATDADLMIAVDRQQTRLASPLDSSATSMTVENAAIISAYNLLSIDDEIVKTTGAPVGNVVPISRGFDGTTPALHLASATVSGFIDAYHHNALVAEVEAIEQALGVDLVNIAGNTRIAVVSTDYSFGPIVSGAGVSVGGGNLVVGNNVLTFATVPKGVSGTNVDHYLWIANGTGTAEAVRITGGSGVPEQTNGQIIVNCAFAHSGAWSIESASNGIAEACQVVGAPSGGTVLIPAGTHEMRAPVRVFGFTTIRGVGQYNTRLRRTRDYGHTFVMGFATVGVDNIAIEDVFFLHDLGFTTGAPPVVLNKPTSGAHCQVSGGNTINFRRCRFQDLVYGIAILGGAQIMIDDCVFQGLWSPAHASGQVTEADIAIANDATLGIATYIKIRGCGLYAGYRGPANEVWGSRYRIRVNGVEDLEILGGAIAAAGVNSIQILPTAGGGMLGQVRITAGVRFDGSSGSDINITGDGVAQAQGVSVIGCQFNGQALGLGFAYSLSAIYVTGALSGTQAVCGLHIADNIIFNYYAAGIYLQEALEFNISGNIIYMYNLSASGASGAAAIAATARANNGLIQGNLVGGDNTGLNAYGAGNNHCLYGIVVGDPAVAQSGVTVVDNYPPFPTAIGTPTDLIFQTRLNQVFFFAAETGANNAIAATLPNVPVIRGLRVAGILSHSLQAGANTFNLSGTGAKPIKKSSNPTVDLTVAYVANGAISMLYDGAAWLDLSQ